MKMKNKKTKGMFGQLRWIVESGYSPLCKEKIIQFWIEDADMYRFWADNLNELKRFAKALRKAIRRAEK